MVFSAGDLCCASEACVLLDTASSESSAAWDTIPHVTDISFVKQANNATLITSSSNGNEIPVCGSVKSTGNLAIACHNGVQPNPFCINGNYHIMWSIDCDNILESPLDPYYEAIVKITAVPVSMNIAGNQPQVVNYSFEVVEWIHEPDCQTPEG